ncbi:hypothetical protein N7535_006375, partial [Penicillium sp. DV-2018c]
FDVSDGILLDQASRAIGFFQGKASTNPEKSGHLGRVMIVKVSNEVTYAEIHSLFGAIPLPQKGALPEQNCVTWTRAAIRKLQGTASQSNSTLTGSGRIACFCGSAVAEQRIYTR